MSGDWRSFALLGTMSAGVTQRMATPEMSDTTTDGVRVGATAYFLPDQSEADERRWVAGEAPVANASALIRTGLAV